MSDLRTRLEASLSATYRLERELGSGGMAVVYLAQDLRHKRRVALKVLRPDISAIVGPERFLREIETLANLTHPHILPLHDSGEADGLLYYVMPYVDGESLRDRLQREKQLPLDDALRIAREVADALSHAHARGVIHRDIKPENILFSGGHALVADFGIAAAIDAAGDSRLTETGIAMGTPAYMSPEQALGERTIDARADIYALGCVLYEMLAGEPPFTGPTAQVVMTRRLHESVRSISTIRELVPEAIDEAVRRTLARLPADRFATAKQFADALTGHGVSTNASAITSGRRWRRIAVLTGVFALATTLAFIAWQLATRDSGLDPKRVAVVPFENKTNQDSMASFGAILADVMTNRLTRSALVEAAPSAIVTNFKATLTRNGALDPKALGQATRAGVIITGSYFLRQDSLVVQPEVIDVTGEAALSPMDPVIVPAYDWQAVINEIHERVMVALSSRGDPMFAQTARYSDLPMSMEAYRAFVAGRESYYRGDPERALSHFQRAVQLDPNSMSALHWLALTVWGANFNLVVVDSLLQIVEQHRLDLLPFDLASHDWLRGWVVGDPQAALKAAQQMHTLGGTGTYAAQAAYRLNHLDQAYRYINPEVETLGGSKLPINWQWLAHILHMKGDHERELREVRKGIDQTENRAALLSQEIRALAALGEIDTLRARLEEMRSGSRGTRDNPVFRRAAAELRAHGKLEAVEFGRLAAQWYGEAVADSSTWRGRFQLAATLFDLGKLEQADTIFGALVKEGLPFPFGISHFSGEDVAALGYQGASAATRGERARANEIIAQLDTFRRPFLLGVNKQWQARIAAQLRECDRAVDYLEDAFKDGSTYVEGGYPTIAEIPEFARLECPAYKAFIKPK